MIKWPVALIDDIAKRKVVLFLGAGVSCNSRNAQGKRPKTWKQLLITLNSKIKSKTVKKRVKKIIDKEDYLTACEIIKDNTEQSEYESVLNSEFSAPRFKPASIHEHIFNLDSRIVITPNFDCIYDTYASSVTNGDVKVKTYKDSDILDCIRTDAYLIIKMHGTIHTPSELIFTHKEYSEARIKYAFFYSIIASLAMTRTFLFIGCGLSDPDVRLLFEDQYFKYRCSHKHYFLVPKDVEQKEIRNVFMDTMNLKMIEYDSKNDHAELNNSLKLLVDDVGDKRSELANKQLW